MPHSQPSPSTGVDAAALPELLTVGRVVAAQGLKGDVRILPLSDFPQRFTRPGRRWLHARGGATRAVELLSGRQLPGKELFVVRLAGIDDREAAEAIVGQELQVAADDRPPLNPGEFHLLDLVGLEVRLLAGPAGAADGTATCIGRVTDLIHAGNDLLEVERSEDGGVGGGGGRRLLIPFVEAIVPVVDLAGGWIGITPPPGLLEL